MKKKIAALIVASAMVVSMMVSCSSNGGTDTSSDNSISSSVGDTSVSSSVNVDNIDIADEWTSGQIAIDGVVYTLPCENSKFHNNGWYFKYTEGDLEAMQCSVSQRLVNGDKTILAQLINMSNEKIDILEGQIGQVQIDANDGVSVVLPGKLVFDENITVEDIKAKYGEPAEEKEVDDHVILNYNGDTDQELKFFIYNPGSNMEKYSSVTFKNFCTK